MKLHCLKCSWSSEASFAEEDLYRTPADGGGGGSGCVTGAVGNGGGGGGGVESVTYDVSSAAPLVRIVGEWRGPQWEMFATVMAGHEAECLHPRFVLAGEWRGQILGVDVFT